jgi:CspA family cold shock protein
MKELDRVRKLGFLFLDVLEPQQQALLNFPEGIFFNRVSVPVRLRRIAGSFKSILCLSDTILWFGPK